jgi:hypothetical protein
MGTLSPFLTADAFRDEGSIWIHIGFDISVVT